MTLGEALAEVNDARLQLEQAAAMDAIERVLVRRACRVLWRLCMVVFATAGVLRDTRQDLQQLRADLQNTQTTLLQLRTDFDGYVSTHP